MAGAEARWRHRPWRLRSCVRRSRRRRSRPRSQRRRRRGRRPPPQQPQGSEAAEKRPRAGVMTTPVGSRPCTGSGAPGCGAADTKASIGSAVDVCWWQRREPLYLPAP
uniref:Predicted protein n=1 Tax=Hordeum vulgare subsp. vulgare TaxID=112509 RepID=F2E6D1_HORVV|nr:predicted protein [Hordeum vulgare subsp. vulgare]